MRSNNILYVDNIKYQGKWFSQFGLKPIDVKKEEEPWKHRNGIFVFRDSRTISIYTDNFGTTPVFYDIENNLFSNDLEHLSSEQVNSKSLDRISFWESMIFDYSFDVRTSIKNIIQIPGGSTFKYSIRTRKWSIDRWNYFDVHKCSVNNSLLLGLIDKQLLRLCEQYWTLLKPNGFILLPLSGGLDSRLLAMYLSLTGDTKKIKAVTFGFSKKSQEFSIAKRVCEELGIEEHYFHPVSRDSYREITGEYWDQWRGCLSVSHGHLYSFLKRFNLQNAILVTGFFADPIAGYAASRREGLGFPIENQPVNIQLTSREGELLIKEDIVNGIKKDLNKLYCEWEQNCNRFEFSEYLYLSQRQSKTFSLLLQSYRKHCDIVTPFADPLLASLFLSAPYDMRKNKQTIRDLIHRNNNKLANIKDLSSAITKNTIENHLRSELRKWSSRVSLGLRVLTKDRIKYFNPYWTEDLIGAYRVECRKAILFALKNLSDQGILSEHQVNILKSKPIRNHEISRIGTILSYMPMPNHRLTK